MKQNETSLTVGVDVSKQRLDVFELGSGDAYSIPNSLDAIEQWLDRFQIPTHEFGLLIPSQSGIPPSYQGLVDRR